MLIWVNRYLPEREEIVAKSGKVRIIMAINFLQVGPPIRYEVDVDQIHFKIIEHQIGWDVDIACKLLADHDGFVDGFALPGMIPRVGIDGKEAFFGVYLRLMRVVQKSPLYLGQEIFNIFAFWKFQKLSKTHPHFFRGKQVLFQSALTIDFTSEILRRGGMLRAADPLFFFRVPLLIKGVEPLKRFLGRLKFVSDFISVYNKQPFISQFNRYAQNILSGWVKKSDMFVTYAPFLEAFHDLSAFAGKTIILDQYTRILQQKLGELEDVTVIELFPRLGCLQKLPAPHASVFAGILDQLRLEEKKPISLEDFAIAFIEKHHIQLEPDEIPRKPQKCAFIVHPLSLRDMTREKNLRWVLNAPKVVRDMTEKVVARMPIIKYGEIKAVISDKTGRQVDCDIYAIMATPQQLLTMDEEFFYRRMVDAAELAKENGALIMGLGAYTKVIGDAGVTVARRSPIPITTGNSYTVATTLWAGKVVLEKLRLSEVQKVKRKRKKKAKAMIIGATGSIGRVSALIVSEYIDEIVLVAPRPDKLLELKEEVMAYNQAIKVIACTNPNEELATSDFIVVATSSTTGYVLDMMRVKSGAVICDCSQPINISPRDAKTRPDVLIVVSGEITLPGHPAIHVDLGLPKPSVYACLAETVLLTLEERFESFSLSRMLTVEKVKEISAIGRQHGAKLSSIRGPLGDLTDGEIAKCRALVLAKRKPVVPDS